MAVHEEEEAFVKRFVAVSKQDRYLFFLSKQKTRKKFLSELYHSLAIKGSLATEILPRDIGDACIERLQKLGSREQVYIISPYSRLDQQWLPLTEVVTKITASGSEAILCCLPGELAFFQSEDAAYILYYKSSNSMP